MECLYVLSVPYKHMTNKQMECVITILNILYTYVYITAISIHPKK